MAGDAHCENWGNNSDFFLMVCSGAWAGVMGTPRVMTHSAVATKLSKLGQPRQLPSPVCCLWCDLCAWIQITDLSNSTLHPQPKSVWNKTLALGEKNEKLDTDIDLYSWSGGGWSLKCRHQYAIWIWFSEDNECKNYGHDSDYECTLRNKKLRYCVTAAASCMLKVKVIFMPY